MTEAEAKRLGRLIQQARLEKGLSFGELAELSDTDKGWLHRLENGQRAEPDPALLTRVTEALGIDPARVDQISGDHLAASMPGVRTYFRSKEKLPAAAIREIEVALKEVRAKYNRDAPITDVKARTP